MVRYVRLGDLTPEEKDRTILVLSGFAQDLRKLLLEIASSNGYVRHRYERLLEEKWHSMPYLEAAYVRTVEERLELERLAKRNEARWEALRT